MIENIDQEMHQRNINGIIATGDTTLGDPDLTYLAGVFLARGGIYAKRRDQGEELIVSNIDVGSAKKGRVKRIESYTNYGFERLVSEHGRTKAYTLLIERVLKAKGIDGKVVVYGRNDVARSVALCDDLRKDGIDLIGERSPTLLEALRETKGSREIQQIEDVARRSQLVVEAVLRFISKGKPKAGKLRVRGRYQTIGATKRLIDHLLADNELQAPEGSIFAVGPSSADPHNPGIAKQPIRIGQPIIFDIFPQADSGYWYDMTRTYVLGKITRKIKKMHEATLEAQETCLDEICAGKATREIADLSCKIVERHGFLTVRDLLKGNLRAQSTGYIHSLGHGVGLTIGERPYLSILSDDVLAQGHVFTVEPGVYEPRLGGVRVEDTVILTGSGVRNPAKLPKDLAI